MGCHNLSKKLTKSNRGKEIFAIQKRGDFGFIILKIIKSWWKHGCH